MKYTNIHLNLENKRWKNTDTSSFCLADTELYGKPLEVSLDRNLVVTHAYPKQIIREYLYQLLLSSSDTEGYFFEELGENYIIYGVMFYDDYNECYQTIKYIAIADVETLGVFIAHLGE